MTFLHSARIAVVAAVSLLPILPATGFAQGMQHSSPGTPMGKGEGEVRKVDKDTKKITLKHGPIEGMDMPGMTMVFQVADPAMLDTAKVGDKVRFTVRSGGGAMTLQSLEKTQ